MKKLILILILLSTLPLFGQVRLSTMDSITTFGMRDYSYWNALSGAAYLNRKVSWHALTAGMEGWLTDSVHTWDLTQTFSSGATFSAGANGAVTFNDSVVCIAGAPLWVHWIQRVSASSTIGSAAAPFFTIYANNFTIPNTEGNDSVSITYDDSLVTFSKDVSIPNLTLTESIDMDSTAGFTNIQITPYDYTPGDVTDSVITMTTLRSNIRLVPPGDMTNIENLVMPAPIGQVVILYHTDVGDSVTFEAGTATGAQVFIMGSNFIMDEYDSIAFMLVSVAAGSAKGAWMELWRKDN